MSALFTRRTLLERCALLAGGAALGAAVRSPSALLWRHLSSAAGATPLVTESGPSLALSLAELQRRARQAQQAGAPTPPDVASIGGLNRVHGFIGNGDDIVLLGEHDASAPLISVDDLMIALRSAYQTDPQYSDAPGCTIDPRDNQTDPWAIQDVRVLGMPPCRMAARFVALDYELKFLGSGIRKLEGVLDTFGSGRDAEPLCLAGTGAPRNVENRFWFAARYPDAQPRFETDATAVLIRQPIEVQVLTERRRREGSSGDAGGPSSPEAQEFADSVTRLLLAGTRPEYKQIRNDFRIIEVGQLLRFAAVPRGAFTYLLDEHEYEQVNVPAYVVGIQRTDRINVVCGGTIDVTPRAIRSTADVRHIENSYRGGVTAHVDIQPAHVVQVADRHESLRRQVLRVRPSTDALTWSIRA